MVPLFYSMLVLIILLELIQILNNGKNYLYYVKIKNTLLSLILLTKVLHLETVKEMRHQLESLLLMVTMLQFANPLLRILVSMVNVLVPLLSSLIMRKKLKLSEVNCGL